MQRVVVLGSTGSIGVNTLDVLSHMDVEVVALSCNRNIELLKKQVEQFKPEYVCIGEDANSEILKELPVKVLKGSEGLVELCSLENVDVVVNGLVGSAGLLPSYTALKNKKTLALANKESLVIAGNILTKLSKKVKKEIVPVDSEHSAIYQCLEGRKKEDVERIILTASGGPFFEKDSFEGITVKDALAHPNWNMGKKITIDSATMMNKGFEIIEAYWLFGFGGDKISVVIHPESIIHSAVEFIDGSIIAQLADHDMRIPIAYALSKPGRIKLSNRILLDELSKLTFKKADFKKFPTLAYAYKAVENIDRNLGLVLNVADECAVEYFLDGKIDFVDIFDILKRSMEIFENNQSSDIFAIMDEIERLKREIVELINKDYVRV